MSSRKGKLDTSVCTPIFTIGSARITGSLISYTEEGKVVVHHTSIERFVYQEELDVERFTKSMMTSLVNVTMDVAARGFPAVKENLGRHKIADPVVVLTAPWYISQTSKLTVEEETPSVVTEKKIRTLVEDEIENFQEQIHNKKSAYNLFAENSMIAESKVIRTELNGYITKKPIGKEASTISLTLFISLVSREINDKIVDIISKTLDTDLVHFHSATLVSYLSTEEFFKSESEYLILEIHGEVTEATLVYDSVIEESASYPVGSNSVIRIVSEKSGAKIDDIATRMKLMTQGEADRKSQKIEKLEDIVYESVGEWVEGLYRTLKKVAQGKPVPHLAYLLSDPQWENLYTTALKDRSFELFTFTDKPFTIISTNGAEIRAKSILKGEGKCIPLALLTGLIHKQIGDL